MIKLLTTITLLLALATPAAALPYDISYTDNAIRVSMDVYLRGADPGDTLRNRWEQGIESIWSTNRFAVPILFNVDWVTEGWDTIVNIVEGPGRWNTIAWYTVGGSGWGDAYQERVAAHEYGHFLMLHDEYPGGWLDPLTGRVNTGGLMATLAGPTLDYYYDPFLAWYAEHAPAPVPEPSTVLLLVVGIGVLLCGRKFLNDDLAAVP